MIPLGKFFPSRSPNQSEIRRAVASPVWIQAAQRSAATVLRDLAQDDHSRALVPVFLSTITKTMYKRRMGFKLSMRAPGDLVEMRVGVEIVQGWQRQGQVRRRADFLLLDAGITTVREVGDPGRSLALLDPATVDRWLVAVMGAWVEMVTLELPKQILPAQEGVMSSYFSGRNGARGEPGDRCDGMRIA